MTSSPLPSNLAAFGQVDIRVGTVVQAQDFPQARKPAYRLHIDLGPTLGIRRSSAQLTGRYEPASLLGRQVLCVVNLPPRQIGPFVSEVLVLGLSAADDTIVLIVPDAPVPNGHRLH